MLKKLKKSMDMNPDQGHIFMTRMVKSNTHGHIIILLLSSLPPVVYQDGL